MIAVDPAPPAGRREQRRQERRATILRAASTSFLENGYAATSMSALLKTLGGSKATLWGYFPSKEALFAAAMDEKSAALLKDLSDALQFADSLEAGLLDFCRRFLDILQTPDAIAMWRVVVAESFRFPEIGRIFYERVVKVTETALTDFITHFAPDGELRSEPPALMARFLLDLCTAQQNRSFWAEQGSDDKTSNAEWIVKLFDRSFRP